MPRPPKATKPDEASKDAASFAIEASPSPPGSTSVSPSGSAAGRRINDVEWISSADALAALGIRKESFYTYVSRGLIKSERKDGQKQRVYRKADVERLQTRAAARSGTPTVSRLLRYGEPIVQTWISEITPKGPRYRGYPAIDLVKERRSFEYVAELIWSGLPRPRDLPWPALEQSIATDLVRVVHGGEPGKATALRFVGLACAALSAMERGSSDDAGLSATPTARHIVQVVAGISGLLGPKRRLSFPERGERIAECVARGLGVRGQPDAVAAINAALVLSAEHELSAPTFTVRICASTGADLFACVAAGVMAQSGPMQAGGTLDVEQLLALAAQGGVDAAQELAGSALPCFGHPLYDRDPRAAYLLDVVKAADRRPKGSEGVWALIEAAELSKQKPNIFAALAVLGFSYEFPMGCSAYLHTLGRLVGWIAHATEQRLTGAMLRPRARYMGTPTP